MERGMVMGDFLKGLKTNYIVTAVLCIVLGGVLFLFPGTAVTVVCRILGFVILAMGIVYLVSFFSSEGGSAARQMTLGVAIILGVFGIWILVRPASVISLIPVITGVILLIHGLSDLRQAIVMSKAKFPQWWLAMLFAVITLALGVLLIFNPFGAIEVLIKMIGVFLCFDGVSDLWIYYHCKKL